jgi:hypothetical protein
MLAAIAKQHMNSMSRVSGDRVAFVSAMGEPSLYVVDRYWVGRDKKTQEKKFFPAFFPSP